MADDRSRYGLLVSVLGAVLTGLAVFLPWYGVSFTASGVARAQLAGEEIIARYGNAALQGFAGSLHASLAGLAGRDLGSVTGHQVLGGLGTVLLVLAALALVDALLPLVRSGRVPDGAGRALPLLGLAAGACVAFRILVPPAPAGDVLSLSPREGAWLALVGAGMIIAGGLWPRTRTVVGSVAEPPLEGVWAELSGWTPQG
jgi:hypothetical protein